LQIGEAISFVLSLLGFGPDEEQPEFVAVVTEVTVVNGYAACRGKSPIPNPHWKRDDEAAIVDDWKADATRLGLAPGPYSKRAAVLPIKKKAKLKVKVKVIKSKKVSGDAKLVGAIGDLVFRGTCPTGVGEHVVDVVLDDAPTEMRAYRGHIRWRLQLSSPAWTVSAGASLMELYFIIGKPREMFDANGVWVELLRLLFGRVRVAGTDECKIVFSRVAMYTFRDHKLKYDTFRGAPSYYSSAASSFKLQDYINRASERCNCYDQASAVQVFAGAVGCASDWLFLQPFGYINVTNLIGVGVCNSPFFGADTSLQLVAPHDPRRTSFGNHAFVGVTGSKIVDSCAGPHLGNESRTEYLDASIDQDSALYSAPSRHGTTADIVKTPGILTVL
jgi:hypothetical protein